MGEGKGKVKFCPISEEAYSTKANQKKELAFASPHPPPALLCSSPNYLGNRHLLLLQSQDRSTIRMQIWVPPVDEVNTPLPRVGSL